MIERPSATAAFLSFLFGLLCLMASPFLAGLLALTSIRPGVFATLLYAAALDGVAFAVPALLYYRRHTAIWSSLRLRRLDPLCAVLTVFAAFLGVLALSWLSLYWSLLLNALGISADTGAGFLPRTPQELYLSLATTAVVPALVEELLFRGLLLPSLEKLGRWPAVLASGILFALPHARLMALPAHLLLGILLGWLVLLTGNLYASMLFHGVYNAAIILSAYFFTTPSADAGGLPAIKEALDVLPIAVILLGAFLLLSYAAMERGRNKGRDPLPAPARLPLTAREKSLLALSLLLLTVHLFSTYAGVYA